MPLKPRFRLIVAIVASIATCSVADALDTLMSSRTPMVLTKQDFPDIPADPSVCHQIELKCLEPISGENRVALPRPVRLIDFKTVGDLGVEVPSGKGIIPIIAFVEVPNAPGDKIATIDANEALILRRKFQPEFNSGASSEDVAMPFFSVVDPGTTADGLCLTAPGRASGGPYSDCFVYRIRKSGHVYDASIIGVTLIQGHIMFDSGDAFNYPTNFLSRVGPALATILTSSKFLTQASSSKEMTITDGGARVIAEPSELNEPDRLTIMTEIVVRTDFPPKTNRTFEIEARTTLNSKTARFAHGDIFWSFDRPPIAKKDEWTNETQRVVATLGKTLCKIYGNRQVTVDEQPSDGIVHSMEGSITHRIICSPNAPHKNLE